MTNSKSLSSPIWAFGICQLWEIVSYVCSGLASPTEKWHKKNINSADRKHSTTLLRVTMMMIWTSKIWWRWLLMFWFQCRSSPWCVWPVSPNGILIAHLWRQWLPFNGLQYNWLNMYFQWGCFGEKSFDFTINK